MKIGNMTYLVKEGARNILHNKLMSFACVGVLVACLLLIGGAALFSLNVNSAVEYVEQQNEVVAFLSEDMSDQDVEAMELTLRGLDNVGTVSYVAKDEGLEELKVAMDDFSILLEGLEGEENPLLDKFVIQVKDPAIIQSTVEVISNLDGIYKINVATEVAEILTSLKRGVSIAGAAVVIILVAVSVVIITNTIKLTVFSRRKEINIMKYVGATDTFIRLPFLVEGMLIGLLAASLAFLLLGIGYTYLMQYISDNYAFQLTVITSNAIDFWDIALYIFACFAGLGIFIGVVGSGVFVRKYLKV